MNKLSNTALLLCFCASIGEGAPILGTLNVTGSVVVSGDFLDFSPAEEVQGYFTVVAGSTGTFSSLGTTLGTIFDLSAEPGTPFPNLISMLGAPGIGFDLTHIRSGIYAPSLCAGGFVCTPEGSIYNVVATSQSTSTISFGMDLIAVQSLTGERTPYLGLFTIPVADWSLTEISGLFAMDRATTLGTYAFAAQFVPIRAGDDTLSVVTDPTVQAVPEPSTWALMVVGAIGVLALRARGAALAQRT